MGKFLATGLALGSLAAFLPQAQAALQCAPREKVIEVLGQRFQENRKALGLPDKRRSSNSSFPSRDPGP